MSTCSYCKSPISPGTQICPHCRTDFLPAWNNLRRGNYQQNSYQGYSSGTQGDGSVAQVVIIGVFLWLYWEAAVWLWNTGPVQWVVNTVVSVWNWF